jgi:hypothetical protein
MNTIIKKIAAIVLLLSMLANEASAFCGFYVSKADGTLKNKTSQVILVRDGNRTVITMSNDFKGNIKDFAMVVPVPVVLKKTDIKVADAGLFQRLNDYSAARLVEYYDENPCMPRYYKEEAKQSLSFADSAPMETAKEEKNEKYKVTIEAQYTVGEYDIVILSAEESGGLKKWLDVNGYKIPAGAEDILHPYIKSNLKFFVVKVNLEEQKAAGAQQLRPLQIGFESTKFMLPIRLGMANADGDQDMIVYAFTKSGRVEATNYRTVNIPTGKNIPLFVKNSFGNFYTNLFNHQWKREGKSIAMLEYAWDVSPANYLKCDPCVSEPPNFDDFKEAGVWWLNSKTYNDYVNEYDASREKVFFTRLHVRYNRQSFAQDLQFQVTPNTENFQARYIITHPANGDLACDAGKKYLKELKERRKNEMEMLAYLTGKGYDNWDDVATNEDSAITNAASYGTAFSSIKNESHHKLVSGWLVFSLTAAAALTIVSVRKLMVT